MNCPICKIKIPRIPYEDVWLNRCSKCWGILIRKDRLTLIQSRQQKSQEELLDEVAAATIDTTDTLRCPHCLAKMQKKKIEMGSQPFLIDTCERCHLIWLDNGELAKMQAVYEFSSQGKQSQSLRQRHASMTDEEKAQLEKNISRLPKQKTGTDLAGETAGEITLHLVLGVLRHLL